MVSNILEWNIATLLLLITRQISYLVNFYLRIKQAVASEGGTDDAKRRGDAFARAFSAHLARLSFASL